jgi:hypothetical protein
MATDPEVQFRLPALQIFWEVVGLERGPLSLVSTIEELLEIKSSGSGLENRDYGRRDSSRWQRGTVYPQQLTLTSSTSCGRSVGIVRSRTQAMELKEIHMYTYRDIYCFILRTVETISKNVVQVSLVSLNKFGSNVCPHLYLNVNN